MKEVEPFVLTRKSKKRVGKGFSLGELKEAKLSLEEAKKLGLRIDKRRKSLHAENVKALRDYLASLNSKNKNS